MQGQMYLAGTEVNDFVGMLSNAIDEKVKQALQRQKELLDLEKEDPYKDRVYLTRKETAGYFGVSLVTLNDWEHRGVLIPCRIGTRVRYKKSEVYNALNSGKVGKFIRNA